MGDCYFCGGNEINPYFKAELISEAIWMFYFNCANSLKKTFHRTLKINSSSIKKVGKQANKLLASESNCSLQFEPTSCAMYRVHAK